MFRFEWQLQLFLAVVCLATFPDLEPFSLGFLPLFDDDFLPPSRSSLRLAFDSTRFCLTSSNRFFFLEFASIGVLVVMPLMVTGA